MKTITVKDHSVSKEFFELQYNSEFDMLETSPLPSPSELSKYYDTEDYISHTDAKRNLFEKVYHLVRSYAIKNKISLINSLSDKKVSLAELMLVNGVIVLATYLLEKVFLLKHESRKSILYEKIENVKPENHENLIADLKDRTGLDINRVQVGRIDFLRDTVKIIIYYYEEDPSNSINDSNTFVSNRNE